MAWRIVKQPNGLLARFSDIVDDFTHMDMTENEALEVCREYCGIEDAKRKVLAGVQGYDRWNDSVETIELVHGKEIAEKRKEYNLQ